MNGSGRARAAIAALTVCFFSCLPYSSFRTSWLDGPGWDEPADPRRESIVNTAKKYLGARYRRGGNSPSGFDCSGYVRYVFDKNGISLPRSAARQFDAGRKIEYEEMKPGDLLFFMIDKQTVSHVAIYIGKNRFIHAPSNGKSVSYSSMHERYWQESYAGSASFFDEQGF
jgi:cell wall-associated NlpC family hydrolase